MNEMTAVGYYGGKLQQVASEIQGLGYTLSSMHSNLQGYVPRGGSSSELLSIAGTAARLKTQIDHLLSQVEKLCLAGEAVIAGPDKS